MAATVVSQRARVKTRTFEVRVDCYIGAQFPELASESINGEPVTFVDHVVCKIRVPVAVRSMQRSLYLARREGRKRAIRQMRGKYGTYIYTANTKAFLLFDPQDRR